MAFFRPYFAFKCGVKRRLRVVEGCQELFGQVAPKSWRTKDRTGLDF
jgi:hypothetical protein